MEQDPQMVRTGITSLVIRLSQAGRCQLLKILHLAIIFHRNYDESAFWYTGTVNYDFTFDVSSWTETSGILALFVNNNWYDTGGGGGDYSTQTAKISIIEFS